MQDQVLVKEMAAVAEAGMVAMHVVFQKMAIMVLVVAALVILILLVSQMEV